MTAQAVIEPFDPSELTEEEFLLGPDRDDDLDIDDVFSKEFENIYADQLMFDRSSVAITPKSLWTPSIVDADYRFVDVEAGVLLIGPDGKPCGGYIGCDVAIGWIHRGRGLGSELILEYAMRHGRLPTWDLDEASYSTDGYRAHCNAHAMARDRVFFDRKRQALKDAASGK
ncbi:hypothetical protein [Microvirga massiliensis]|uniref:hypothetical protein n=1 Tax=Microvirga massiliensis TaxID=1033741 RepID=UPI00062BEAB5|nr:hypothetical protein [Microvirga massiliensis]